MDTKTYIIHDIYNYIELLMHARGDTCRCNICEESASVVGLIDTLNRPDFVVFNNHAAIPAAIASVPGMLLFKGAPTSTIATASTRVPLYQHDQGNE